MSRATYSKTIGIVVPTLGARADYLEKCLRSLRENGSPFVVIVSPFKIPQVEDLCDKWVTDSATGLSGAINLGLANMPEGIEFVTWLGDDDSLTSGSLQIAHSCLLEHPGAVVAYGNADYVDADDQVFWHNRSGRWAIPLLSIGPNRIPQPGSLVRFQALKRVGFLDEQLRFAMDLDMFLKLRRTGSFVYVNKTLARYRWHTESLSAGQADDALFESSLVRIRHSPKYLKNLVVLSEKLHVALARVGTSRLDRKLNKCVRD